MARTHQASIRLTDREWSILHAWLSHQTSDPDTPIRLSDAIRQAIRDLEANEKDRARKRKG